MIKSIITTVLVVSLHVFGFAQNSVQTVDVETNLALVFTTVEEKSEITGTITNTGGFSMFIDDAIADHSEQKVEKFTHKDLQSLIQVGYNHIMNSPENTCFRYRIITKASGIKELILSDCPF